MSKELIRHYWSVSWVDQRGIHKYSSVCGLKTERVLEDASPLDGFALEENIYQMCDLCFPIPKENEAVNHPSHYNQYQGLEIIDLVEQMNFNRGNAVKYISRAGFKDSSSEVKDLKKALWYIQREIDRITDPFTKKD